MAEKCQKKGNKEFQLLGSRIPGQAWRTPWLMEAGISAGLGIRKGITWSPSQWSHGHFHGPKGHIHNPKGFFHGPEGFSVVTWMEKVGQDEEPSSQRIPWKIPWKTKTGALCCFHAVFPIPSALPVAPPPLSHLSSSFSKVFPGHSPCGSWWGLVFLIFLFFFFNGF